MRRLLLCVALVLLPGAIGCRESDTTPETKITTKDGQISAVFPHIPTPSEGDGREDHVLASRDGRTAFLLLTKGIDDPFDITDNALVERTLEAARKAILFEDETRILDLKKIELGTWPGEAYDSETAEIYFRVRGYVTGKHVVHIGVHGSKKVIDGPEAKKFLDSLKIEE